MNVDNVRELFLQDVVERAKNGRSPLFEWKERARKYYFYKRLSYASFLGILGSSFFAITKRNSGRMDVYLLVLAATSGLAFWSNYKLNAHISDIRSLSDTNDMKKIKKAMYFHNYSLIE